LIAQSTKTSIISKMPVYNIDFKKPISPWMKVILNLLLAMMTTGAAYANTGLQDTVIGHFDPMCECLSEIRAMIESRTGKDVFFEIRGVRRSADIMLGLIDRLINDIQYLIRRYIYDSIVDEVRNELMLLSDALGFDIPVGLMEQLHLACQFRLLTMSTTTFIKLMPIVCAIALTGYDLSISTKYTVLKTVPMLPAMLETCKIQQLCDNMLSQIYKLFLTMFKSSKRLGPLGKYMRAATATTTAAATMAAAAAAAEKKAATTAKRKATKDARKAAAVAAASAADAAKALTMFKK
jgi:hypothetical protein